MSSTDYKLSPDERQHAERFAFERDRHAFSLTRTVLRHLLTAYTGRPPTDHRFLDGPRHKPELAEGGIHFNVSHSASRSLLAFALRPIGVDIERIRSLPEMEQIVGSNFAEGECRRWRALAAGSRELGFFLCWTRKEAYVKALGDGLYRPLDSFEVSLDPGGPAEFLSVPDWSLYDLPLPGYAAAVALGGKSHSHRAWSLDVASTQLALGPP